MFRANCWAIEPNYMKSMTDEIILIGRKGGLTASQKVTFDLESSITDDAERSGLPVRRVGSVALIPISGPMMKSVGYFARYMGFQSTVAIGQAIMTADADDEVGTIVLVIDSPGGTVAGTMDLARVIREAQTPIIAQTDSMCASAAYWAATQCSKIHAAPGDEVGSIGVRMFLWDDHKYFEDLGMEAVVIDTGEFKSAGAYGSEVTERHRADFQRLVNNHFEHFKSAVMKGRGLSLEQWKEASDGRMFMDDEAVSRGLVDRIMTLEDTLASLQKPAAKRKTQASRGRVALRNLRYGTTSAFKSGE